MNSGPNNENQEKELGPFLNKRIIKTVWENAKCQSCLEFAFNYLNSCINHGGEIAFIALIVKKNITPEIDFSI